MNPSVNQSIAMEVNAAMTLAMTRPAVRNGGGFSFKRRQMKPAVAANGHTIHVKSRNGTHDR
jgi:hypothetical protein